TPKRRPLPTAVAAPRAAAEWASQSASAAAGCLRRSRSSARQRGHEAVAQGDAALARAIWRVARRNAGHDDPGLAVGHGLAKHDPERLKISHRRGSLKTAATGHGFQIDAERRACG